MTGANLRGARLVNTQLNGADLTGADLTGANFAGAKLNGAVFTRAKLSDTDFTNADIENATFSDAILTPGTKGLKGLSEEQSSEIQFVLEDDEADKSSEDTNPQDASNTADVSITRATSIVGPASAILEVLPIPNDPNFTAEHHDLLRTLQRIVNELNIELGKVEDQNRRLTEEPEVLRMVEESLPVWRQTWLTFIGSAAGSLAGQGSAFATGYTVGFIAGVLHDSFSPSADCLI